MLPFPPHATKLQQSLHKSLILPTFQTLFLYPRLDLLSVHGCAHVQIRLRALFYRACTEKHWLKVEQRHILHLRLLQVGQVTQVEVHALGYFLKCAQMVVEMVI